MLSIDSINTVMGWSVYNIYKHICDNIYYQPTSYFPHSFDFDDNDGYDFQNVSFMIFFLSLK